MNIILRMEQKMSALPGIFKKAGIIVKEILVINKVSQAGYIWLKTKINSAGKTRKESGTFSENSFWGFFTDKNIMASDSIDIKVNAGNQLVGNLIIEFSPIKDINAFKNSLSKVIPEIVPQLGDLFFLMAKY